MPPVRYQPNRRPVQPIRPGGFPGYRPQQQPFYGNQNMMPYQPPMQQPMIVMQQPTPPPAPTQPAATPAATPAVPAPPSTLTANTVFEYMMKHPIAPVAGALLWAVSQLADDPDPPKVPADLPAELKTQWTMIYAQNQARFQRRMALYQGLGEVLLGVSSANSILDAIKKSKTA
jgi:hypothetical protein